MGGLRAANELKVGTGKVNSGSLSPGREQGKPEAQRKRGSCGLRHVGGGIVSWIESSGLGFIVRNCWMGEQEEQREGLEQR